jgi:hypothetical protein
MQDWNTERNNKLFIITTRLHGLEIFAQLVKKYYASYEIRRIITCPKPDEFNPPIWILLKCIEILFSN